MKNRKIKNFLAENWNYIVAFLLPWILITVHSVVNHSWLTGDGSILSGDAGNIYYEMYVELWSKVHNGGSIFYSWNAGGGMDFLVNVFQYLVSPFTLIVLLVPKSCIVWTLQFIMVLKWSLIAITTMYFFMHTKHNEIRKYKKLISFVLSLCFTLGNAVIQSIAFVSWGDVIIIFPVLLLLEEYMVQGRGYKRFYGCLVAILLCNFRMAVPVLIFSILWYMMQLDWGTAQNKSCIGRYFICMLSAILTAMVIILPCIMGTMGSRRLFNGNTAGEYAKQILMSLTDFVQRFFVCDSLNISSINSPMLYVSVVGLAMALLYLFVDIPLKKKIWSIGITALLCAGMFLGGVNLFWHGFFAVNERNGSFAFLLSFMIVYMAMVVLGRLDSYKIWNVIIVLAVGIALIVYAFFHIEVYLDFYVYLASILLFVLILMLMVFCCKKSIKYNNYLIVFSVFCLGELAVNAYIQMREYNMYPMDEVYYNHECDVLVRSVELQQGERTAFAQGIPNYGMVLQVPSLAEESCYTNESLQNLYQKLGMSGNEKYYEYFGGSPLLNVMFNVRYGMSQSEVAFSDVEKSGENNGYSMYRMNNVIGLGYMVQKDVASWNLDQNTAFEIQNDYISKAVGGENIFEAVIPEISCSSLLGGTRLEEELERRRNGGNESKIVEYEDPHKHGVEEESQADSESGAVVEYNEEQKQYCYLFEKMYSGDVVTASYESDGESDYYVYVQSEENAYFSVMIGENTLYEDMVAGKQKIFHIGKVKKGETISILTNAVVDDLGFDTLYFQVAAFNSDKYNVVYDSLSKNVYQITDMKDDKIEGQITADFSGIMMTSVPASEGWKVYVDGKETRYEKIGGALIGVPVEVGEHTIVFVYSTPYIMVGAMMTGIGILLFAGYCVVNSRKSKEEKE